MGKSGTPSLFIRQPIWSIVLSVAVALLGIGNLVFHASLSNLGKRLSGLGLWIVLLTFVGYSFARYTEDAVQWLFCWKKIDCTRYQRNPRRSSLVSTIFFLSIAGGIQFLLFLFVEINEVNDLDRGLLTIVLVFFSLPMFFHYCAVSRKIGSSWSLLLFSIFFILTSFGLEALDVEEESLCFPESNFQTTAFAHILLSLGFFTLSDYYIKDVPIDEENSPRLLKTRAGAQNLEDEIVPPRTDISHPAPVNVNNVPRQALRNHAQQGRNPVAAGERGRTQNTVSGAAVTSLRQSKPRKKKTGDSRQRTAMNPMNAANIAAAGAVPGSNVSSSGRNQPVQRTSRSRLRSNRVSENIEKAENIEVEQMWTCSQCNYTENSIEHALCDQCSSPRPSLDSMVAVPLHSMAVGTVNAATAPVRHERPASVTSARQRRSRDRGIRGENASTVVSRRPNSKTVRSMGSLSTGTRRSKAVEAPKPPPPNLGVQSQMGQPDGGRILRVVSNSSAGSRISRTSRSRIRERESQKRRAAIKKQQSKGKTPSIGYPVSQDQQIHETSSKYFPPI
eukprot:snap_masked-scaffold_16-processed-gene-5.56-mRNA-1 protein AED:1.00 eAED:1.00 QI:0/0/0/0/1/1/2/0/560